MLSNGDLRAGMEVRLKLSKDDIRELPLEAPDRFLVGFPLRAKSLHVGLRVRVSLTPRQRHYVEGVVQLTIAAAVEPVSLRPSRGSLERSSSCQHRECALRSDPRGITDLYENLGGEDRKSV